MKLKIISDGTNTGTKLIDEDTGEMIHMVQKITYEATADDTFPKVTIELINVPVEIVSEADVDLYEYTGPSFKETHTKSFAKKVRIISKPSNKKYCLNTDTKIYDADTNELVGAIQKVKWSASPKKRKVKIKKIKFDKKDW